MPPQIIPSIIAAPDGGMNWTWYRWMKKEVSTVVISSSHTSVSSSCRCADCYSTKKSQESAQSAHSVAACGSAWTACGSMLRPSGSDYELQSSCKSASSARPYRDVTFRCHVQKLLVSGPSSEPTTNTCGLGVCLATTITLVRVSVT